MAFDRAASVAIVTRDVPATAVYAAALAPLGLATVAMPVTRTEPPPDPDALVRALERGGYSAIAIASTRAAWALIAAHRLPSHAALPEVWAVGPATARELEDAGIATLLPTTPRDGAALAHAMLAARALAGKRVLVPRAADGRDEVLEILRGAGVEVDDIVAYRTVAVAADDPAVAQGRELLAAHSVAVCVVFAPSQVAALDAIVPIVRVAAPFVAIGDTTAAALREAGATVIGVAASPTPAGIANAVAAVYPARP